MLALTASSEVPLVAAPRRVAARGELIACAHDDDSVHVWSLAGLALGLEPLQLAHDGPLGRRIELLALSDDGRLVVGSREHLALYTLAADADGLVALVDECPLDAHGARASASELLPLPTCAAFEAAAAAAAAARRGGGLLALALLDTVHVFETVDGAGSELIRLEGHRAAVSALAFVDGLEEAAAAAAAAEGACALLLSASEDRTFKLWDLRARALCYSSPVTGASPFLSVAVEPVAAAPAAAVGGAAGGAARAHRRFAVGAEDGTVHLLEIVLQPQPPPPPPPAAGARGPEAPPVLKVAVRGVCALRPRALLSEPGWTQRPRGAAGGGGGGAPVVVSALPAWRRAQAQAQQAALAREGSGGGPGAGAGAGGRGWTGADGFDEPAAAAAATRGRGGGAAVQGSDAILMLEFVRPHAQAHAGQPPPPPPPPPLHHLGAAAAADADDGAAGRRRRLGGASGASGASLLRASSSLLIVSASGLLQLDSAAFSAAPLVDAAADAAAAAEPPLAALGGGAAVGGGGYLRAHRLLVLLRPFALALSLALVCDADAAAAGEAAAGEAAVAVRKGGGGEGAAAWGGWEADGAEADGEEADGEEDEAADGEDWRRQDYVHAQRQREPPPPPAGGGGAARGGACGPPAGSALARALALTRPPPPPAAAAQRRPSGGLGARAVKSSGYGATAPRLRLHGGGPATLAARARRDSAAAAAKAAGARGGGGGVLARLAQPYSRGREGAPAFGLLPQPTDWAAAPLHASAALRCAYAPDGGRLASAAQSGAVALSRLPAVRHGGESVLLVGHTAAVRSLQWSHAGSRLLTASDDGSACVWRVAGGAADAGVRTDPELRIAHALFEPAAMAAAPPLGAGGGGGNAPLGGEVRCARWFYLDALVLIGCGPSLLVYALSAAGGGGGGGKVATACALAAGAAPAPRYRLGHRWSPGAQSVTALAAANDVLSNLVFVAASDKSLTAYDLHASRPALALSMPALSGGGHSRPIRSLALAADAASELLLSAAADSTVRLWDLRAGRSVRCFASHANGHHALGAAFSPCMRYVGVGGEGRHATLYCLQSGSVVQTLGGHGDVVSDVAFHPRHPQLATACFDGRVRFWNNE